MKFSLFYVYLNSALLCIFVDWIELIFIHSFLLVLFFFSCLVLYVVSVVDLAKLLWSPTTAQVVKTRHFSTANIYPPEPVVQSNNKKSLMSKAVLRQFCFGILTFLINYCSVQIKQAKNGARKKSQQERRKYKSSQQHKFHKLVCKRAESRDAPIGKGLFIY